MKQTENNRKQKKKKKSLYGRKKLLPESSHFKTEPLTE